MCRVRSRISEHAWTVNAGVIQEVEGDNYIPRLISEIADEGGEDLRNSGYSKSLNTQTIIFQRNTIIFHESLNERQLQMIGYAMSNESTTEFRVIEFNCKDSARMQPGDFNAR